jgi:hypothetical protein
MTASREWVITASAERPLEAVVSDLTKAGFVVQHTLTEMNVITGTAGDETIVALRKVPGVLDVAPGGSIDIGPPDAEIS